MALCVKNTSQKIRSIKPLQLYDERRFNSTRTFVHHAKNVYFHLQKDASMTRQKVHTESSFYCIIFTGEVLTKVPAK